MPTTQIYSVAGVILDAAFYADCSLSKNALAPLLKISRPSIVRYEAIAYWKVPDFKEDYPKLPKELWLIKKCNRDREVPLSPYQIWVVSLIKAAYSQLGKKSAIETYIQDNAYIFTRVNYHSQLRKLAKMYTASA